MIKFFALIAAFIFINAVFVLPAFASETDGTIDANYRYAWGENIGWISLNCSNTNSCDSVDYKLRTDWRPQSVRKAVSISSGDISKLLELKYIETQEDITNTKKVVFKVETRTNVATIHGEAKVVVPDQTEVVRSDGEKMDFTKLTVEDTSDETLGVEDQNIVSAIQYGIPGVGLTFNNPITISIPVDSRYNNQPLKVYKSSSATDGWKFLTTCNISNSICMFNTTTASHFAVTKDAGGGGLPSASYNLPLTPSTGFSIVINNGDDETTSRRVTLGFNAGMDVKGMSISNYPDFNDAILENYIPLKEWDVCSETGGLIILPNCPEGAYTVYVKFYTRWGRASEAVSDSIVYKKIRLPETTIELPFSVLQQPLSEIRLPETEEEIVEELPIVVAPTEPLLAIPQPPFVIPSEPPVGEESQTVLPPVIPQPSLVIPLGEEEFVQEEIVTLYERATTSGVLVAAISNVRLMYGEITRSALFATLYVLLLSVLLFVCGKEARRWYI